MISGQSTINDLHGAAKSGDVNRVKKWIVDRGAAVDTRKEGYTPLHKASQFGHVEVVGLLISLGADIHKKSFANYTALHFASQHGHIEVVKILLEKGADSAAILDNGKTARELAIASGFSAISLLLEPQESVVVQTSQNTNTQSRFSDGGMPEPVSNARKNKELAKSEPSMDTGSEVKKDNFLLDRHILSPAYIEDQFINVKQEERSSAPNILQAPIKKPPRSSSSPSLATILAEQDPNANTLAESTNSPTTDRKNGCIIA